MLVAPYAVNGLAVLAGVGLCPRGGGPCILEADESNVETGVTELDEYELLGGSGAVVGVIVRPEENPEDPPWRLGVQL